VVLVCVALITASAACSKSNKTTTTSDSGGAITVWLDAPRIPGVNVFKKAHPEIPIKVVTIATADSSSTLQEKFTLFNQAGKGWPDAIFYPEQRRHRLGQRDQNPLYGRPDQRGVELDQERLRRSNDRTLHDRQQAAMPA